MKKLNNRKNKGFTLIEVIVAVTIVIILSALAIPKVSAYIDKAKEAKATSMAKQIYTAAIWSYTDQGSKFVDTNVKTAIKSTTNIKDSDISSVSPSNDGSTVTINFICDNKNYKLTTDASTNYTFSPDVAVTTQ